MKSCGAITEYLVAGGIELGSPFINATTSGGVARVEGRSVGRQVRGGLEGTGAKITTAEGVM